MSNIPYVLFNCPIKFNPFQYDAFFKWNEGSTNLYIADEVGLGKTIETGIIIKEELVKDETHKKFLIIAPKFLCSQWKEQLQSLFNIDSIVLEKGIITNNTYPVFILPLSQLGNFVQKETCIKINTLIIDEAHYFRNRESSKRYENLTEIITKFNFNNRILLSATPINNYLSDWQNQINIFEIGKENNGSKVFDESEHMICNKKSEAFPLSKIRKIETVFVVLSEAEQQFYSTTDNTADTEFAKTIYRHVGSSSLYALNKCYENNGFNFEEEEDVFEEFEIEKLKNDNNERNMNLNNHSKAEALEGILLRPEVKNKKIIIFAHYIETCNYIYKRLKTKEYNVFVIKGKMAFGEQQSVKNRFEKYNGEAILICSDVCKEGVNLQCASILINYDLPFNPAILEQRIGRIDRVGQKNEISIFNFVVKGTYDDDVYYQFLLGKIAMINSYAKKGNINSMKIVEEKNDFEIAINNALVRSGENESKLKEIYDVLRKYLGKKNQGDNDISEQIKELTKEIIKNMQEEKQDINFEKYEHKCKEFFKEIKIKDLDFEYSNPIEKYISDKINTETKNYKLENIKVNPEKVRDLFIKKPMTRQYLKPLINNSEEVYLLLENAHEITNSMDLEIKEEITISYEYLNPKINVERVNDLMDWDEYYNKFIPLEYSEEILKI